jgi:hypothetical protein
MWEDTISGFGLAGGGYGEYVYCECGFFSKRRLPSERCADEK